MRDTDLGVLMSEHVTDREELLADPDAAAGGLSRRSFVGALGIAAAGGLLAACSGDDDDSVSTGSTAADESGDDGSAETTGDADLDDALQASDLPEIEWDMATSWPIVLDTIYGGAEYFGERVARADGWSVQDHGGAGWRAGARRSRSCRVCRPAP